MAGSKSRYTGFLCENPIGGATSEDKYDEENVNNILTILTENAELIAKYGKVLVNQSQHEKHKTEDNKNASEEENERETDQSKSSKTCQNETHVNKTRKNETTTSGQSDISTVT